MRNTRFTALAAVRFGSSVLSTKVLASAALIGAAVSVAGLGTYATFTSSTPAVNEAVSSGTLNIALGSAGTASNRLDIGASNVVPGDTIERAVDLSNAGSTVSLADITLTTSAAPTSALDTDAANGLQLAIDACSLPWTESGPPYTYSCSGSTSTVLASRPVAGSALALANLTAVNAGQTDHLRVTLSMPTIADNSLQGLASTIGFVFTGTQRAGVSQ